MDGNEPVDRVVGYYILDENKQLKQKYPFHPAFLYF